MYKILLILTLLLFLTSITLIPLSSTIYSSTNQKFFQYISTIIFDNSPLIEILTYHNSTLNITFNNLHGSYVNLTFTQNFSRSYIYISTYVANNYLLVFLRNESSVSSKAVIINVTCEVYVLNSSLKIVNKEDNITPFSTVDGNYVIAIDVYEKGIINYNITESNDIIEIQIPIVNVLIHAVNIINGEIENISIENITAFPYKFIIISHNSTAEFTTPFTYYAGNQVPVFSSNNYVYLILPIYSNNYSKIIKYKILKIDLVNKEINPVIVNFSGYLSTYIFSDIDGNYYILLYNESKILVYNLNGNLMSVLPVNKYTIFLENPYYKYYLSYTTSDVHVPEEIVIGNKIERLYNISNVLPETEGYIYNNYLIFLNIYYPLNFPLVNILIIGNNTQLRINDVYPPPLFIINKNTPPIIVIYKNSTKIYLIQINNSIKNISLSYNLTITNGIIISNNIKYSTEPSIPPVTPGLLVFFSGTIIFHSETLLSPLIVFNNGTYALVNPYNISQRILIPKGYYIVGIYNSTILLYSHGKFYMSNLIPLIHVNISSNSMGEQVNYILLTSSLSILVIVIYVVIKIKDKLF
ncbi:hypothetical protein [Saccharolobus caldissimus]|uniref:Uncharacterized protein n=1 Tax=Saccharolobus caldissimus TaxID=1702097 RepID=A0AAQ4CUQ7_9CREN|nr:hypothetical protein [Saccharolobus caldissimus]BDB99538.1 hypothetical protein SACC_25550 [Saccharolobus caldissimus]